MIRPTISVLLPCYNSGETLQDAVDSVLAQTFADFELLILDDGSDQPAGPFDDPRIQLLRSEKNLGLSRQLNIGIEHAAGEFIARLDADDIALPHRFETQIAAMTDEPEIGICGSQAQLFDADGDREIWHYPTDPDTCHATLFFRSSFLHPGVMIRKSVLDEHGLRYDETFAVAQDYELWLRLLEVTKGTNLAECLTRYRISDSQLTKAQSSTKIEETREIRKTIITQLDIGDLDLYEKILEDVWEETDEFYHAAAIWFNQAHAANQTFPSEALARSIAQLFFERCQCATRRGFDGLAAYEHLEFAHLYPARTSDRLRMRMKSIIKPALSN